MFLADMRGVVDNSSRREIDLALGVLMGLRRCSEAEALSEVVGMAHRMGVGLGAVSRELLTALQGGLTSAPARQWAVLLDGYANPEHVNG